MLPTPASPADNALLVCVTTHHLVGFLNIPGFLVKSHQQVFVFLCPNYVPTGQEAHRITGEKKEKEKGITTIKNL